MRTRRTLQAIFWIAVYIVLAIVPLLIVIPGPRLPRQSFWQLFSVALGFAGLSMMALQFVLTARFKTIKAPYGNFHREISLVAFALVLAHILILITVSERSRALLNFFTAPTHARAALISVLLLIILVALSIWRKPIRFDYTWWRVSHGILGVLVVILAMVHVLLVGFYINTPLKGVLWTAYTVFWILLLFYVRLFKPLLLLRKPYQVSQVSAERGNAWTLHIKPEGHAGMRFQPGQFAWLTFGRSPFSETEHPFSFSSNADHSDSTTFTIKELGDFTRTVKDLPTGQRIYVDGPFGIMSTDQFPDASSFVLIAGGIGIAPMMSMLRTANERSDKRPYLLFYAINTWEEATFREEIEELTHTLKLEVVYVLRNPPEKWNGESGYITKETLDRYLPQPRDTDSFEVFLCGSQPLMNSVEEALVQLGVFIGSIHAERFDLV
jgi:3-phenylpropionate/trans-cinnamate dioxygenase ferredoxin reductase subunit